MITAMEQVKIADAKASRMRLIDRLKTEGHISEVEWDKLRSAVDHAFKLECMEANKRKEN